MLTGPADQEFGEDTVRWPISLLHDGRDFSWKSLKAEDKSVAGPWNQPKYHPHPGPAADAAWQMGPSRGCQLEHLYVSSPVAP